jgi:N-acylglucosamine 2-epimerase
MLFSVTRSGQPLRLRRYHFSEQFFAMACAEYAVASGDMDYMRRAREMAMYAWDLASSRIADISGYPAKVDAGTRATLTLAEPLMLLTTFSTLLGLDDCNRDEYDTICTQMAEDIVHRHLHIENKFVYENVPLCGVLDESQPYGRLMNPGHVIEGSWILLDYARQANREDLAHAATLMFRYAYEAGWDAEYGGLFSFVDRLGYPPEPIEHDMKYWWPHCELLIASLKMALDGDESCREIFDGTWRYCRDHFIDGRHGEWFGYLRRDGSPVEPGPKGNMFKGPFHVPRALMMVERLLAGCESVPPVHEQG